MEAVRSRSIPLPKDMRRESAGAEAGDGCHSTAVLTFTTKDKKCSILMGKCLGDSQSSTFHAGMDQDTGEWVVVAEWSVEDTAPNDQQAGDHIEEQIATCEKLQLRHPHLVPHHAMSYKRQAGRITVNVLFEYIRGVTVERHVRGHKLSVDVLKEYTTQLLDVLCFLHDKGFVHGNLKPSSIMIDNDGHVQLAGHYLRRRLSVLVCGDRGLTVKDDIYQMGRTLLYLALGKQVPEPVSNIPEGLPNQLIDFLTNCLKKDEEQRWSASQLKQHSFLTIDSLLQSTDSGGGRLEIEFEDLGCIGEGGFGVVRKMSNKWDKQVYAMKKIAFNHESLKEIIREVEVMSSLCHPNVVRYFSAWIEKSEGGPSHSLSSVAVSSIKLVQVTAESAEEQNESDWSSFSDDGPKSHVLYIQMELCVDKTLREVIDNGDLYTDMERLWKLFREIIGGLVHIHQKDVIHRDLKPNNIFLSSSDDVKIGDFGLSRAFVKKPRDGAAGDSGDSCDLSGAMGTRPYASPEMMSGDTADYNQKTDMYSLGMIFFEMCYRPITTVMESQTVLPEIPRGTYPEDFDERKMLKEVGIINKLLKHNPKERPTSQGLLRMTAVEPELRNIHSI